MEPLLVEICKNPVVVVGLSHLGDMKKNLDIDNFYHLEIGISATSQRHELLKEIKKLRDFIDGPATILFQAGESLSTWFIYHLQDLENTFLIDMGRSLDLWAGKPTDHPVIPDMTSQAWQKLIMPKPKLFL